MSLFKDLELPPKPEFVHSRASAPPKRHEDKESLDFYRTPFWATEALVQVLKDVHLYRKSARVLDPCAGDGWMVEVLQKHFDTVIAADIVQRDSYLDVVWDYTKENYRLHFDGAAVGYVIANPPFNELDLFLPQALMDVERGGLVCFFGRVQWLEGMKRYETLWAKYPPLWFCPFVERVNCVNSATGKATGGTQMYAWFIWRGLQDILPVSPHLHWIPSGSKKRFGEK